jgi:hypothetical protein
MTDPLAERAEAAAIRRRWITLGEVVAVAGLFIAAISLWLNWSDKRSDEAEKHAEKAVSSRYEVAVTIAHNGDLLMMRDASHPLGDVAVAFPAALDVAPHTSAAQTIELGWYRDALMRATSGGPDKQTGRLPVLLHVDYWDGDSKRTTTGIYDIVWKTNGRPLLGRTLHIEGLTLRARGGNQAMLDRLWQAPRPKA